MRTRDCNQRGQPGLGAPGIEVSRPDGRSEVPTSAWGAPLPILRPSIYCNRGVTEATMRQLSQADRKPSGHTAERMPSRPSPGLADTRTRFPSAPDAEIATPAPAALLPLLAAYGALAPSPFNVQPWCFRVGRHLLELCLAPGHGAPQGPRSYRELVIACGAALFNMRVALRHFGYHDGVTVWPHADDDRTVAQIRPIEPRRETNYNRALFRAVPVRHTVRSLVRPFESRALPNDLVDEFTSAARACGGWLHVVTSASDRRALADLVFEAGAEYRAQLLGTPIEDGLNDSDAADDVESELRTLAAIHADAHRAAHMLRDAPLVAILGTDDDDPARWVAGGEALEHVLLLAAAHGVFAAYANHPLRLADLRPWVSAIASRHGQAHVLLGLGFTSPPPGPPRRLPSDVIDESRWSGA